MSQIAVKAWKGVDLSTAVTEDFPIHYFQEQSCTKYTIFGPQGKSAQCRKALPGICPFKHTQFITGVIEDYEFHLKQVLPSKI